MSALYTVGYANEAPEPDMEIGTYSSHMSALGALDRLSALVRRLGTGHVVGATAVLVMWSLVVMARLLLKEKAIVYGSS
jgi:hypothetical protein